MEHPMMSDEDMAIADGNEASAFLNSEAGKRIQDSIGKQIYNSWRVARTPLEREAAWYRSEAFNTLFAAVQTVAEKGQAAKQVLDRKNQVAAQEDAMKARRSKA